MQQIARLKLYPIGPEDGGSGPAQKTEMLLPAVDPFCIFPILTYTLYA
jgi:hypothetical protein